MAEDMHAGDLVLTTFRNCPTAYTMTTTIDQVFVYSSIIVRTAPTLSLTKLCVLSGCR